jgi:hypothetical protein
MTDPGVLAASLAAPEQGVCDFDWDRAFSKG